MREHGGVEAQRQHVSVGQAVVLHRARRQAAQRRVAQRVHDAGQALRRRLQDLLRRLALVVHRVDVRAVRQQLADHLRRARVQLADEVQRSVTVRVPRVRRRAQPQHERDQARRGRGGRGLRGQPRAPPAAPRPLGRARHVQRRPALADRNV